MAPGVKKPHDHLGREEGLRVNSPRYLWLFRHHQARTFCPLPLLRLGWVSPFLPLWVLIPALPTTVLFLPVAALGPPPDWGAIGFHCHPCSNSKAWTWLKVPLLRMGGARGAEGERERERGERASVRAGAGVTVV